MTLVELLVYSVLLAIVLTVVGSLLISTLRTQGTVRAQSEASTTGQAAMRLMERSIRNAAVYSMPSGFDNNLLITKTRVGEDPSLASSWECRAWYFDPMTGDLVYTSGPATGTPVTADLTPPIDTSGWSLVFEHVTRAPDADVFQYEQLGGVKISFDVRAGSSEVSFRSTVISRDQGQTIGGADCV